MKRNVNQSFTAKTLHVTLSACSLSDLIVDMLVIHLLSTVVNDSPITSII